MFETFGKLIVLLGEPGAGQRAKIVNNALMAANMGLAQAALAAGEALGCDRKALAELVAASSGRSFGFEVFARLPISRRIRPRRSRCSPRMSRCWERCCLIMAAHECCADAAEPFLTAATQG